MTRREAVYKSIAHEDSGVVPYYVNFTPEAAELLREHYKSSNLDEAVGNFVRPVYCPWWQWSEGEDHTGLDAPSRLPTTRGTGSYDDFQNMLRELRDTTDCYILVEIYGSHFEKAYFARGIDNFLADMSANRDYACRLLNQIITKNLVMLENILSCDEIDGVLLGSDWGSQRAMLMSPQMWREMIAPGEQKEYDLIKSYGKHVWIHSCGNVEPIIPDLISMGVDVLNPVQPEAMDISLLKRTYGDQITFWGGISTQQVLPYGTPDQVRAEAARVNDLISAGGGYIASPSQYIQDDVPLANILALIEALRQHAGNR